MIKFGESGPPVYRATSPLSRGTLNSKEGGKLSVHFCANGDTIETVFRTRISVNQLGIYGAVSDLSEEYSTCQTITVRLALAEQSDPLFVPANLLTKTPKPSKKIPAQENLLQKHKERVEKLPQPDRLIKISGSCCAMGPLMLIANEASMRTASKGGVALKTAPLSSGAIVDRRFVSITTKRERYSLAVSLIKELSLGSGSPRASAGIRFRREYRRFLFRSSLLQCRPRFNLAEMASTRQASPQCPTQPTQDRTHQTNRISFCVRACARQGAGMLVTLSSRPAIVAAFLANLIKDLQTIADPNGWFQHQCPCSIVATDLRTQWALVTSSTLDSVHLDQFSFAWFVPALCATRLFMQESFASLKLLLYPGQQYARHLSALTHKVANQ